MTSKDIGAASLLAHICKKTQPKTTPLKNLTKSVCTNDKYPLGL